MFRNLLLVSYFTTAALAFSSFTRETDCVVSEWSEWKPCSADCGGGTQGRQRSVSQEAQNGGKSCEALEEEQACNTNACPVDCVVSEWGQWGVEGATGTGRRRGKRMGRADDAYGDAREGNEG